MIPNVLMDVSSSHQRHCEILPLFLVIDMIFSYLKNLNLISALGDVTVCFHFQVIDEEVE